MFADVRALRVPADWPAGASIACDSERIDENRGPSDGLSLSAGLPLASCAAPKTNPPARMPSIVPLIVMAAASKHQFVAAYFSNQDGRSCGILFDLLP